MTLEWIIGIPTLAALLVGVTWVTYRISNPSTTPTTPSGGAGIFSKLSGLFSLRVILATTLIIVSCALTWLFWDNIKTIPDMTALAIVTTLGIITFSIIASYGVYEMITKGDSPWPRRFAGTGITGVLLISILVLIFGEDELSNPAQQDLHLGPNPIAMGYINIHGDWIQVFEADVKVVSKDEDGTLTTTWERQKKPNPAMCVPFGKKLIGPTGDMYDFAENNRLWEQKNPLAVEPACFNDGRPLIPNSREHTPDISGFTPQGIVGKLTTTPAEKAAEEAAKKAEEEDTVSKQSGAPTTSPSPRPAVITGRVKVPPCSKGMSELISIPSKHRAYWDWQERIAKVQYLGPSTDGWSDTVPSDSIVTDLRFCVANKSGNDLYANRFMGYRFEPKG